MHITKNIVVKVFIDNCNNNTQKMRAVRQEYELDASKIQVIPNWDA